MMPIPHRPDIRSPRQTAPQLAPSLAKQSPHPPQHAVLLRVVRVVFAWDLEDGGKGSRVRVNAVADLVGDLGRESVVSSHTHRQTHMYIYICIYMYGVIQSTVLHVG